MLLVIDMQNDACRRGARNAGGRAIVENVVREIKNIRRATLSRRGTPIRPTIWRRRRAGICQLSTACAARAGLKLAPAVAEALGGAEIVDKPGFGSIALSERLHALSEREEIAVTLIGLCTDICVVSNALLLRAFLPEATLRVRADCCAGVTPESHRAALRR